MMKISLCMFGSFVVFLAGLLPALAQKSGNEALKLWYGKPATSWQKEALLKAWPSGKVTGLRARGGFTVDLEWKDGQVSKYRVRSDVPRKVTVRVNGKTEVVKSEKL